MLQAAIRGAFTVFVVVVAIDLLDGTQSSVGVLMGAVGVGALLGSLACTLLVGSRAMTRWLGVAIVLWGAPLAIMGLLRTTPSRSSRPASSGSATPSSTSRRSP